MKKKEILFIVLGITGLKTDKIHLPREVLTLSATVNTIQTKNIAADLIVLKFHRSICHKSAKIIGHNVSLTKKYSVILIYFRPMAIWNPEYKCTFTNDNSRCDLCTVKMILLRRLHTRRINMIYQWWNSRGDNLIAPPE